MIRSEYDFIEGVRNAYEWYDSLSPEQQAKVGPIPPLLAAYPPHGELELKITPPNLIACDPEVCERLLRDVRLAMEKSVDEKRGGIRYVGEPHLGY